MAVAQHTAAELVHGIFDFQRALRGVMAAGTRHSDLGPAHAGVLFYIGESGSIRASSLAAKLGIGPSALSRQLADLEQEGLITRTTDPLDGRACLLSLTDLGEAHLARTYERRAETLRDILSDWTESEAAEASSTVRHLTRSLRSAGAHPAEMPAFPGHPSTTSHAGNDGRPPSDTTSATPKEEF